MKKNNELFSKRLLKYISKKKKEEITYHEEDTSNNHSEFMNSLERQINISSDCYKYKTRIVDDRTSIEKGDSSVTLLHKDKECECSEKVFVSYSWTPESNKTWVKNWFKDWSRMEFM